MNVNNYKCWIHGGCLVEFNSADLVDGSILRVGAAKRSQVLWDVKNERSCPRRASFVRRKTISRYIAARYVSS